ncbi:MAG: hypothetical protein FJ149_00760 [Euryarchaeota archaeon]|nr:hypothetical protein [Euryarchaeota archaeon]
MDRGLWAAAVVAFVGSVVAILVACGGASATNDPPPSGGSVAGDWTVTDGRAYNGVTITLAGNLTVESGGTLILDGARLVMAASSSGQYGIEVRSGGRLVMQNGANLTSSSAAYRFAVRPGGALNISDSEVRRCGYAWGSRGETAGLFLESDGCTLARTLVTAGYYGVVVDGASPAFDRCRFEANSYGAGVTNSSATFAGCLFTYNINGANLDNCSGRFGNCTFAMNTGFGLLAYRSGAAFDRCDIVSNPSGNCVLVSCGATFSGCTFRDGVYGAYAAQGSPVLRNCTVTGNRFGAYLYKSSAELRDCKLDRNSWYAVSAYYGEPALVGCELSYTGYSAVDNVSYGTGLGAFGSDFSMAGGRVHHNYQGVECRYSSPRMDNVTFDRNDYSVWAYQSGPLVDGCSFSGERTAGVRLEFFCTGEIARCTFSASPVGASFEYFVSTSVRNSTFRDCRSGIRMDNCGEGALVRDCLFEQDGVGANLAGSTARLEYNTFRKCINASVMCSGSKMTLRMNNFTGCAADALQLQDCRGLVERNTFESNEAAGIYCLDSTTTIANNTFRANGGSGVLVAGKRSYPEVRDNLFRGNGVGVALIKQAGGAIHHNALEANAQVGISAILAHGEIYCNTISGSERGVSCDSGASPSVHDNEITGCEGGLVCHLRSNASVRDNRFASNTRFGIEVVESWPEITGNVVSGSRDGIRVQGCPGPARVVLRANLVFNNTDGVWARESALELLECNFSENSDAGAYCQNSTTRASRCTFDQNGDGLVPSGGTASVSECDFIQNNGSGVLADATAVTVSGCFFSQNLDGILDIGNSSLYILDGVYERNVAYAIYFGPDTEGSWTVERAASSVDDRFRLACDLVVSGGGSLRLANATLFMFLEKDGEHSIVVRNGGRLEVVLGSLVGAAQGSKPYGFRVEAGGNLTLSDSAVERCGQYPGGLEGAGLHLMSSGCTLRAVTFRDCGVGLVANGIRGSFQYLSFIACGVAVEAVACVLVLDNCTVWASGITDIELRQEAKVVLLNTTIDPGRTSILGPGCELSVYWYLMVNAVWQNKEVIPRAQVALQDRDGGRTLAGYTDDNGWLQWVRVLAYVETSTGRVDKNPYNLSARMGNVTAFEEHTFDRWWTWWAELRDTYPPIVSVDFPPPGARLNATPVVIRGFASDPETGLERLEWSLDGGPYDPLPVEAQWYVTAPLEDGNHTVLVRATDAVGNQALERVDFTVKTRIRVLDVQSPADGLLTRSAALLVGGLTESGARIQVNGREVPVLEGRFSTTVYLAEGENTILVAASDDAGNTATVSRRVVLDTEAPFIEVLSPLNGSYLGVAEAVVTGRTEPGARLFVEGVLQLSPEGRFTVSVSLPGETNTINITAVDTALNSNTTLLTVHVDLVPPSIGVLYPPHGKHVGRRDLALCGTTEPFSTVTAGDAVAVAGPDGAFVLNLTLLYGNNTIIIRSTDRAGNFETLTWHIVRDRPPSDRQTPWVPAVIAVAAALAAENAAIYLYWRRRGGAAPSPPVRRPGPAGGAARPEPGATAEAPPAREEGPAPPEALPVGEDEPVETVEMK